MSTPYKELMASIHNRFAIEVIDAKTGNVKQKAKAENVICSNMWTAIMDRVEFFTQIWLGGGSGVPSPSDNALFSLIGRYNVMTFTYGPLDVETGVYSITGKTTIPETSCVGRTLTELGIGYTSYDSGVTYYLCSHAMITDMNGNPISIVKSNTDILNIYATLYLHIPERMILISEDEIVGPDFRFFPHDNYFRGILGCGLASYPGTFFGYCRSITGPGDHTYGSEPSRVELTRSETTDAVNKKWLIKAKRCGASSGNFGFQGFEGAVCSDTSSHSHSTMFFGKLPGGYKINGEALGTGNGTKTGFATKFEFPYDAKVYVDGVLQTSGVTVVRAPGSKYQNMEHYFFSIDEGSKPGKLRPVFDNMVNYKTKNLMWYNPWWELGLTSISVGGSLHCSNDLENWTKICDAPSSTSECTIPSAYRKYKYWKKSGSYVYSRAKADCGSYNVIFDVAPAEGSVITIDYTTDFVPKDSNHVYDFSFSVELGEYTGN